MTPTTGTRPSFRSKGSSIWWLTSRQTSSAIATWPDIIPEVIASPYGFIESAGWLKRFIFGPGRKNAIRQPFPPFDLQFEKVEDARWYAFMGDIMSLGERKIVWAPA